MLIASLAPIQGVFMRKKTMSLALAAADIVAITNDQVNNLESRIRDLKQKIALVESQIQ
jgi:hypothetical protein